MNPNWIEPLLDRHLRPAAAPRELWNRIQDPQPRPKRLLHWKLAVALMLAVATAWALHPRAVSMDSDRAADIREWVRARTGFDVPLSPTAPIQLCGSRVVGASSAEIRYRSGDHEAVLLVARADHYTSGHQFIGRNAWILRGQSYSVSAADLQSACLLCHAGESALN